MAMSILTSSGAAAPFLNSVKRSVILVMLNSIDLSQRRIAKSGFFVVCCSCAAGCWSFCNNNKARAIIVIPSSSAHQGEKRYVCCSAGVMRGGIYYDILGVGKD